MLMFSELIICNALFAQHVNMEVSRFLERDFISFVVLFLFLLLLILFTFYQHKTNQYSESISWKEDEQYFINFYRNDVKYNLVWKPQILISPEKEQHSPFGSPFCKF